MEKTKVLIVDDHEMMREGIKLMLKDESKYEIIGEASDGKEAIELSKSLQPDLVIMDINMPVMNGIEATSSIIQDPQVKILAVSMNDDKVSIKSMLAAGAHGYILKNAKKDILIQAMDTVLSGENYFCKDVAYRMVENFLSIQSQPLSKEINFIKEFSEREREVLKLISDGLTAEEVGDKLCISKRTVDTHRRNMLEKTGAKNTTALVKYAIQCGFIE